MHPYATDSAERTQIPLILSIFSVLSAYMLPQALGSVNISVPWWFDAPSVVGFYGLYITAFDRWLWRWSLLRRIGLTKLPDLSGIWQGDIASSYDGHQFRHEAKVSIHQTWSRVIISFRTDFSSSCSVTATVLIGEPNDIKLSYEYQNEPNPGAIDTMHAHRGTVRLSYSQTQNTSFLSGYYYTGRDRSSHGTLCLTRR